MKLSSGDKYNRDGGLERLLDLDGLIMEMGEGYCVKIDARRVEPAPGKPHGIDYSLCLFSPDDERLVCFDNAHPVGTGSGPARRLSATRDHVHIGGDAKPYDYTSAEDLMVDFWSAVDRVLKAKGVP